MKIQIIDVEVTNRGKFDQAEVSYKNLDSNKTESKKIMSFSNADVFKTVKEAKKGEQFNVKTTKDDKGYWQWSEISSGAADGAGQVSGVSKATGAVPAPRSTYETPEERAQKQIYIVRQSSVSSAIELLKTEKKVPSVAEVLDVAKQFEDYVFGNSQVNVPLAQLPVNDLEDDAPF